MPTQGANGGPGVATAAKNVAEHASSLARLELELALIEVKRKLTALGLGIGMLIGAAVIAVFFVGFVYATIAAALATFLPVWLALLLVSAFLLLKIGVLAILGIGALKKGTPPVPEQAIQEAKLTTEALRSHGG